MKPALEKELLSQKSVSGPLQPRTLKPSPQRVRTFPPGLRGMHRMAMPCTGSSSVSRIVCCAYPARYSGTTPALLPWVEGAGSPRACNKVPVAVDPPSPSLHSYLGNSINRISLSKLSLTHMKLIYPSLHMQHRFRSAVQSNPNHVVIGSSG